MSKMPIAEQHRIVHELVNKYKFQTEAIYEYSKVFHGGKIRLTTEDHYSPVGYGTYFRVVIRSVQPYKMSDFNKSIQELQETCFQDLLNPTENELTLFELQYGFKWPLTGDMNEIT